MSLTFEKVTIFVIRKSPQGSQLLTFLHPIAGRQIPAGSVDQGENIIAAARREVREETGIANLSAIKLLGTEESNLESEGILLKDQLRLISGDSKALAGPPILRRGHRVTVEKITEHKLFINQRICDLNAKPEQLLLEASGWVSNKEISTTLRRHFFVAIGESGEASSWENFADGYQMKIEWVSLENSTKFVPGQDCWIRRWHSDILSHISKT